MRALVYQLIKSVLTVGAGFAPNNWAGFVLYALAIAANEFTVAFHIGLLQVSGEARHALIVRQYRVGGDFKEVVVPNPYQRHDHRHIFF